MKKILKWVKALAPIIIGIVVAIYAITYWDLSSQTALYIGAGVTAFFYFLKLIKKLVWWVFIIIIIIIGLSWFDVVPIRSWFEDSLLEQVQKRSKGTPYEYFDWDKIIKGEKSLEDEADDKGVDRSSKSFQNFLDWFQEKKKYEKENEFEFDPYGDDPSLPEWDE